MKAAKLTVIPLLYPKAAAPVSVTFFLVPVAWAFEPILAVPVDKVLSDSAKVRDTLVFASARVVVEGAALGAGAPDIWASASSDSSPVMPINLPKGQVIYASMINMRKYNGDILEHLKGGIATYLNLAEKAWSG